MQFNFVVSTNTAAVALWQKLGFAIVGTLPKAFRHQRLLRGCLCDAPFPRRRRGLICKVLDRP
jgi:RimJ/RimL family protein N-acetyltransferase